jgi:hypothetical protein
MNVRSQKPHTVGQPAQRPKEKQIIENNSSCKTKTTKNGVRRRSLMSYATSGNHHAVHVNHRLKFIHDETS